MGLFGMVNYTTYAILGHLIKGMVVHCKKLHLLVCNTSSFLRAVTYHKLHTIDVSLYGFFGLQNTTSRWMNTTLPSPALNISAFYIDPGTDFYGFNWSDSISMRYENEFTDPSQRAFTYSNETYFVNYIQKNGKCQPVQDVSI